MADIISFKARAEGDRSSDPVPVGGARILLFMGVRYERIEAEPALPESPAGGGKTSGRKRRRRA